MILPLAPYGHNHGAVSYQVNANGNLAFRGNDSFVYGQANRLKTSAGTSGLARGPRLAAATTITWRVGEKE